MLRWFKARMAWRAGISTFIPHLNMSALLLLEAAGAEDTQVRAEKARKRASECYGQASRGMWSLADFTPQGEHKNIVVMMGRAGLQWVQFQFQLMSGL